MNFLLDQFQFRGFPYFDCFISRASSECLVVIEPNKRVNRSIMSFFNFFNNITSFGIKQHNLEFIKKKYILLSYLKKQRDSVHYQGLLWGSWQICYEPKIIFNSFYLYSHLLLVLEWRSFVEINIGIFSSWKDFERPISFESHCISPISVICERLINFLQFHIQSFSCTKN